MFTYEQKNGKLYDPTNKVIGIGYAGKGEGKNNPDMESVKNTGPLPKGLYYIGKPYDSKHTGVFSIPLIPHPNNNMYGRSAFMIHGDNKDHTASEGCIIQPRITR